MARFVYIQEDMVLTANFQVEMVHFKRLEYFWRRKYLSLIFSIVFFYIYVKNATTAYFMTLLYLIYTNYVGSMSSDKTQPLASGVPLDMQVKSWFARPLALVSCSQWKSTKCKLGGDRGWGCFCACVCLLPNPFAACQPSIANAIITKTVVESNRWGNKPLHSQQV